MVYLFEQKLNKYLLQYLNNENHVFKKYYVYFVYINKEHIICVHLPITTIQNLPIMLKIKIKAVGILLIHQLRLKENQYL